MNRVGLSVFALALPAVAAAPGPTRADEPMSAAAILDYAKRVYPGEMCDWTRAEEGPSDISSHVLKFHYDDEDKSDPERQMVLYEVPCWAGAYNYGSVWFLATEYDGLQPLHFAEPDLDVKYADDSQEKLKSIAIRGFETNSSPTNAFFDEASSSITSQNKWRGLGDASSSATWSFLKGRFVLTHFEADPTYDGEINPITLYSAADH